MKLTKPQVNILESKLQKLEEKRKDYWKANVMFVVFFVCGLIIADYFFQNNTSLAWLTLYAYILLMYAGWQKGKIDKEVEELRFQLLGQSKKNRRFRTDEEINEEFDKEVLPKIEKDLKRGKIKLMPELQKILDETRKNKERGKKK